MKKDDMITYKAMAHDHASPLMHTVSYLMAACTRVKPIMGVQNYSLITEFVNTEWRFSGRMAGKADEWKQMGKLILAEFENHSFLEKVYLQEKRTCRDLEIYSRKIRAMDLKPLPNGKLAGIFDKVFELWTEMNAWGDILNLVDFDHFMLTDRIMQFLQTRCEESEDDISAGEAFGILGTPVEFSILQQEEMDLYRILAEIQSDSNAMIVFSKTLPEIIHLLPTLRKINRLLDSHAAKYDWMQFHYEGPVILGNDYFVDLLRSELKQGFNGKRKIEEMKRNNEELIVKQHELEKKLKLSKDEIYWCKVARTTSYLKGLRKDMVFLASCNTDNLIREIGKRLSLSPKQVRHFAPWEVKIALRKGSSDIDLLNERIQHCVFLADEKGPRLVSGKEADRIGKLIKEEEADAELKELKGTPAYPGQVSGIVKLIHKAEDMAKMNEGDVLVSPATNPNVVPAMKKAAAIVTDEGGVTCHAAIVSREMKIPCVIGTKIATRVLKDGDKVEVDATKGIIRKI